MVNIRFYDPRSKEERIIMLIHWLAERCWQATRIERFFTIFLVSGKVWMFYRNKSKEGKRTGGITFKKGIIIANAIASMRIHGWNEGCCGRGRLCLVSAHRLVCGHKPASRTTNPITRLCSPWPPLHSRLCLFIHPVSSEPSNFTNFLPPSKHASFFVLFVDSNLYSKQLVSFLEIIRVGSESWRRNLERFRLIPICEVPKFQSFKTFFFFRNIVALEIKL